MRCLAGAALSIAVLAAFPLRGRAQDDFDVDLALVLVADASGSMDDKEFALQREGIAGAISDPDVLAAIKGGKYGRIAVTLVEWGTPGAPVQVVGWHLIGGEERQRDFAWDVTRAPRAPQSWNALGDGMELGIQLIESCPCRPARKVIDVSGDNPDSRSQTPSAAARDQAVKAGMTVNGLAILNDDRKGPSGQPWLVEIYQQEVIGGPSAFVIPAQTRADFDRALRQKLIQEIASR
ncbi:MAG TPA: DUF1194 domain-containing protein [Candidatus Cybelea sp.]|nr:DUF1194 domain-containing protein [Candidatus Cybelea sp.]